MPWCAHADWVIWIKLILAKQFLVGTLTLSESRAPKPAVARNSWGTRALGSFEQVNPRSIIRMAAGWWLVRNLGLEMGQGANA